MVSGCPFATQCANQPTVLTLKAALRTNMITTSMMIAVSMTFAAVSAQIYGTKMRIVNDQGNFTTKSHQPSEPDAMTNHLMYKLYVL
jgi:hypothetical protein